MNIEGYDEQWDEDDDDYEPDHYERDENIDFEPMETDLTEEYR